MPDSKLHKLRVAGIPQHDARRWAFSRKGYWRIAGSPILSTALPNAYWTAHGLKGFAVPYRRLPFPGMLSEPPGADPHAGGVGRGRGELRGPYPIL